MMNNIVLLQRQNMQLDLTKLSQTQKRFYVQLLAQSNIDFQKKDNQFVAQFRIDSNKVAQPAQNDNFKKAKAQTKKSQPVNSSVFNKKPLGRVVKIGELKTIQNMHPSVEIYIYPKKMPLIHLLELIQGTYERMWAENKKKTHKIKGICLAQWVYQNVVNSNKEKMKIQQLLVNLIDSLNHYMNKVEGIKIFYNFLAQKFTIQTFFYFLVLRGLLQEVVSDKILEKGQSSQGFSSILNYRLRCNPYEKNVSEDEVQKFLAVLCNGGITNSQSHNKKKSFESVFQQLTQKMFYDEHRKKNYIRFYDLLQHLINEYVEVEASSCDMSLSKTELCHQDQSLSELITDQISTDSLLFKKQQQKNQPNCSYAIVLKPDQQQSYLQRVKQQNQSNTKNLLKKLLSEKVQQIYTKLGCVKSEQTKKALNAATQAITQLDKGYWLRYRVEITDSELLSIERLQSMYRQRCNSPVLMTKLVKGVLLLPVIRGQMLNDLKL